MVTESNETGVPDLDNYNNGGITFCTREQEQFQKE